MRVFDVRRDRRATDDPTRARVRGRTRDDASSSHASDASHASVRASIANPPARAKRKQPADRLTASHRIASHRISRTVRRIFAISLNRRRPTEVAVARHPADDPGEGDRGRDRG